MRSKQTFEAVADIFIDEGLPLTETVPGAAVSKGFVKQSSIVAELHRISVIHNPANQSNKPSSDIRSTGRLFVHLQKKR